MIKLLNREWEARKVMTAWVLDGADDGRTIRLTIEGAWECSRDGKATPLVLISSGPELFDRVEVLVARSRR